MRRRSECWKRDIVRRKEEEEMTRATDNDVVVDRDAMTGDVAVGSVGRKKPVAAGNMDWSFVWDR